MTRVPAGCAVQCHAAYLVVSAASDSECCGKACASGLLYDDSSGNTARRSSPGGSPACKCMHGCDFRALQVVEGVQGDSHGRRAGKLLGQIRQNGTLGTH